jgi:hypothetical protein
MTQADCVHSTPPTNTSAHLAAQVARELGELEYKFHRAHNLAYAVRLLATSDEMPREPGAALDSLASTLIDILNELTGDRDRILASRDRDAGRCGMISALGSQKLGI